MEREPLVRATSFFLCLYPTRILMCGYYREGSRINSYAAITR